MKKRNSGKTNPKIEKQSKQEKLTWRVWVLGKPNPQNQGRRAKYCMGRVSGERDAAVRKAQVLWKRFIGQMHLERI